MDDVINVYTDALIYIGFTMDANHEQKGIAAVFRGSRHFSYD